MLAGFPSNDPGRQWINNWFLLPGYIAGQGWLPPFEGTSGFLMAAMTVGVVLVGVFIGRKGLTHLFLVCIGIIAIAFANVSVWSAYNGW
jgi:hypothetical protein